MKKKLILISVLLNLLVGSSVNALERKFYSLEEFKQLKEGSLSKKSLKYYLDKDMLSCKRVDASALDRIEKTDTVKVTTDLKENLASSTFYKKGNVKSTFIQFFNTDMLCNIVVKKLQELKREAAKAKR